MQRSSGRWLICFAGTTSCPSRAGPSLAELVGAHRASRSSRHGYRYRGGISNLDGPPAWADSQVVGIAVLGSVGIDGNPGVLSRRDRVVLAALTVRPGSVVSADSLAD